MKYFGILSGVPGMFRGHVIQTLKEQGEDVPFIDSTGVVLHVFTGDDALAAWKKAGGFINMLTVMKRTRKIRKGRKQIEVEKSYNVYIHITDSYSGVPDHEIPIRIWDHEGLGYRIHTTDHKDPKQQVTRLVKMGYAYRDEYTVIPDGKGGLECVA